MIIPILNPSRCTAKLGDDLEKSHFVSEEKIDGSRYLLYIGCDPYERQPTNALLSRRVSVVDQKHVDRTHNLPHVTSWNYLGLVGTVLDGEVTAKDFLSTNSIMNSAPREAVRKQAIIGNCDYRVFDVLFFRGLDVRSRPLSERRLILEAIVKRMQNENVKMIPQIPFDHNAHFNRIVNQGGEGIVIKDSRMAYGVGWCKMKKSYDVSCIVSGFKPGNGKYSNSIGSIALSVYHDDTLVEIGFASGFDDKIREDMRVRPEFYMGRVVDVFIHEIQDSKRSKDNPVGRCRHPTFYRFRDDLDAGECTSEKLWKDIAAAKTRNRRNKGDE
jgi:bifunctional non-homologous end joining protein LigD